MEGTGLIYSPSDQLRLLLLLEPCIVVATVPEDTGGVEGSYFHVSKVAFFMKPTLNMTLSLTFECSIAVFSFFL